MLSQLSTADLETSEVGGMHSDWAPLLQGPMDPVTKKRGPTTCLASEISKLVYIQVTNKAYVLSLSVN